MSLKNQTKQDLIAKAHTLKPIVIIGNEGLTPTVLNEIDRALYDHELIKVRLPSGEKSQKTEVLQSVSLVLQANCLRMIGHIAILYRPSNKQQKTKSKRTIAERKVRTHITDIKTSNKNSKKGLVRSFNKNKPKAAIRRTTKRSVKD
jgi:RNA-binding protein